MGGIAIYERDRLMRDLLREWLTAAGYTVRDSRLDGDPITPELAIVGVETPNPGSEVLIQVLQRNYPGMPIIALSGWARSGLCSNGAAAHALGVAGLLAKPLLRHELLMAVDGVIGPPGGAEEAQTQREQPAL
jgi:DNA-binding response OmpR family regulator